MQRVIYLVATTIDGRIARPDGSFDIFLNEGDHVADYQAALHTFDCVVMGRSTYEVGLRLGVTNPYPWLETYVVSRTMSESPDPAVTLVKDDPVGLVRTLKERPGRGVYVCGGGRLASALLEGGVVDEIVLKQNPVIAGVGIPVFADMERSTRLELADCKVHASGVVVIRYRVRP
ncbi:MAG: dihydrofolate reductase family protein [Deltaproteobacteria bacterium]|nr:dihydrofolate reductase family protein [Deltaproteobacteria bacterium]